MQYQMKDMPSGIGTIWNAVRKPISHFDPFSDIEGFKINIPRLYMDFSHLASFLRVLGSDPGDNTLPRFIPSIYPVAFVYPVMLRVVSMSSISLPMMLSMVNTKNQICSYQTISPDWTFGIQAGFTEARSAPKGVELDFSMELIRSDETIWQNIVTLFFKNKKLKNRSRNGGFALAPIGNASNAFLTGMDKKQGKYFCRLIGDRNAIHTNSIFAKLLGFKDAFSQPYQALGNLLFKENWLSLLNSPGKFYFEFKGPLYYNERITVKYNDENDKLRFDMYSGQNPRPGILGVFERIEANQ